MIFQSTSIAQIGAGLSSWSLTSPGNRLERGVSRQPSAFINSQSQSSPKKRKFLYLKQTKKPTHPLRQQQNTHTKKNETGSMSFFLILVISALVSKRMSTPDVHPSLASLESLALCKSRQLHPGSQGELC